MDPATKAIIGLLQRDGRRPYDEIADELGLTEAEVEQRVARLEDAGLLQITAVTDPLQMGFARQAMLGVTVSGVPPKVVAQAVSQIPEVSYVVLTAGGFDLLVEVIGTSDAHLLELVTRIKPLEGVTAVQPFLYLELHKQTYTWGVR
ncbi:Lrp/AsnC family transcriptional regulator for asnA, asnC and gidA [Nocardioides aurantiacus]|uniref:Lrp/AsnC family transcriptional regulator for asnA, asnC and gidA n=2 Tax=Nocardioides aurantiacus TaxID=86796 RepID=A0A3N2CUZ3_9ACTN|nr:Lrp/AsnC family transcriptional regulator for asnA, asnC and gidA [Nocardioides aurantiacus]